MFKKKKKNNMVCVKLNFVKFSFEQADVTTYPCIRTVEMSGGAGLTFILQQKAFEWRFQDLCKNCQL